MLKKLLCLILSVGLLLTMLAACGQDASGNSKESTGATTTQQAASTQETKKAEPVHIKISHDQGEWEWPILEELGKNYTAKTGNTIEWIYVPADGYGKWQDAQLLAGTEPDAFFGLQNPVDKYKNGQILDLSKYFNEVSPYTGKPWKESFLDGVLDGVASMAQDGVMVGVPTQMTTTVLYYNKNVFKEVGLTDEVPKSWADVLAACKKIKESGKDIVPFAVMNSMPWNLSWIPQYFLEDVYGNSGIAEKLDIVSADGKLQIPEVVLGIKTGLIDPADQRFVDYYRLLKDLSQYFNKGFNTMSWEYEKLFNEEKAAMQLNGSWYPNQHMTNKMTNSYGVGATPYVDSSISKYSQNKQVKYTLGGGAPNIFVSTKAQKEGKVDTVVDFLRYWTDPQSGAAFFTGKTMFLPAVKDVPASDELKGVIDSIGTVNKKYYLDSIFMITAEEGKQYQNMLKVYLEDKTTPETFAKNVKTLILKAVEQYIKDNPDQKIEDFVGKIQK